MTTPPVHYVNGQPWCDGVNHTTMCDPANVAAPAPVPPEAVTAAENIIDTWWPHEIIDDARVHAIAAAVLEAAAPAIVARALEDQKRRLLARPDCGPADDHERALYWQGVASKAVSRLNELEDLAGDERAIRADERERIWSHPVTQRLELHGGYPDGFWRCSGCFAPLADGVIAHLPRCGEMGQEIQGGDET